AMEVLGQSLVAFRDEYLAATAAFVRERRDLDDLPLDPSGREHKIECLFPPGRMPDGVPAVFPLGHIRAPARRALVVEDLDLLTNTQRSVPPDPRLRPDLFPDFACADINSLALVVEATAAVNVLEVSVEEVDFTPSGDRPQPVQLLNPGDRRLNFHRGLCLGPFRP